MDGTASTSTAPNGTAPADTLAANRALLSAATLEVDRALAEVSESLDFLVHVSPTNNDEAWAEFEGSGYSEAPHLTYRPLAEDPHLMKRALFAAPIEKVEDEALATIFREMQEELDLKVTMLRERGSDRFRMGSLMVYGGVEEDLVEVAKQLLYRLSNERSDEPTEGRVDCHDFARMAEDELDHYRGEREDFPARVELRDDMLSGLMVSGDCLLISNDIAIPRNRAEALIHHEVGTHLVTRFNGRCQPFRLLACGLAGYNALQEGLAVASEYLVDGLSQGRLRTLAGRVLAVECLTGGAEFPEAYASLADRYGFTPKAAFNIVLRVYRGGGLTKDAVYLRGLVDLLNYLGTDGPLEPLLVGKVALSHLPLMRDLMERGVVEPPALIPRYLTAEGTRPRLDLLRQGVTPLDLI